MRVFAYCVRSAKRAVREAVGVDPITSPPTTAPHFNPLWLEGNDLIYFRLHGAKGFSSWFNDHGGLALDIAAVEIADLGGAVVVVANCYGASDPMIQALYMAGASTVIAGEGPNYGGRGYAIGTDLLTMWLRRGLELGISVPTSLAIARARLAMTAWRKSDRDAMAFRVMEVQHEET